MLLTESLSGNGFCVQLYTPRTKIGHYLSFVRLEREAAASTTRGLLWECLAQLLVVQERPMLAAGTFAELDRSDRAGWNDADVAVARHRHLAERRAYASREHPVRATDMCTECVIAISTFVIALVPDGSSTRGRETS